MTNLDLAKKLKSLKNVAPDRNWLVGNRELLLAQISNSGATDLPVWKVMLINFSSFTQAAARPASAFAAFVLLLVTGGLFSNQFFAQAKPNDSLYIARIISEQVRLNTTFNTEARDMLAVRYASEHAKDITSVLADPEFNKEENQARVEELNNSFKAEVETVRSGISRLSASKKMSESAKPQVEVAVETELNVMIAEGDKEGQGIQVQENSLAPQEVPLPVSGVSGTSTTDSSLVKTPPIEEETGIKLPTASSEAEKMLEEASQLFDAKDYEKASEKLKEVDAIIKN